MSETPVFSTSCRSSLLTAISLWFPVLSSLKSMCEVFQTLTTLYSVGYTPMWLPSFAGAWTPLSAVCLRPSFAHRLASLLPHPAMEFDRPLLAERLLQDSFSPFLRLYHHRTCVSGAVCWFPRFSFPRRMTARSAYGAKQACAWRFWRDSKGITCGVRPSMQRRSGEGLGYSHDHRHCRVVGAELCDPVEEKGERSNGIQGGAKQQVGVYSRSVHFGGCKTHNYG